MTYSIGEVASKFNLSVSKLRYYDQLGFFPNIQRDHAGHRQFTDRDLDLVAHIVSLKRANVSLPEITAFLQLYQQGNDTAAQREAILDQQASQLQAQLDQLKETQVYVQFKQWSYDQAVAKGEDPTAHEAEHAVMERGFADYLDQYGDSDSQQAFTRLQAKYPAGLCEVALTEVVAP